jgi:hypothetical protein
MGVIEIAPVGLHILQDKQIEFIMCLHHSIATGVCSCRQVARLEPTSFLIMGPSCKHLRKQKIN